MDIWSLLLRVFWIDIFMLEEKMPFSLPKEDLLNKNRCIYFEHIWGFWLSSLQKEIRKPAGILGPKFC